MTSSPEDPACVQGLKTRAKLPLAVDLSETSVKEEHIENGKARLENNVEWVQFADWLLSRLAIKKRQSFRGMKVERGGRIWADTFYFRLENHSPQKQQKKY